MKVILLMALPGAGKTTWIRNNTWGDVTICSADHWYEREGRYEWSLEQRGLAHGACLRKFIRAVTTPTAFPDSTIVVDNTNTAMVDIAPYVHIAQAYDLPVEVIHIEISLERSAARNVHNAPASAIEQMDQMLKKTLEAWPERWPKPLTVPALGV